MLSAGGTTIPLRPARTTPRVPIVVVVPSPSPGARAGSVRLPSPVQALVIDRQPLFIAALGSLLAAPPLSARVRSALRSDVGLEIIRRGGVHVVFCEVNMQPIRGSELADLLMREGPAVPVILLGDQAEESQLSAALSSSAAGFFTKNSGPDEFLGGVRAVLAGHRAVGSGLMSEVLQRLSRAPIHHARQAGNELSPTELAIIAMIGQAQPISAIAASRGISDKTVRNHLAKIYRKLELHGRTEAVLWAARMGLTNVGGQ